MENYEGIWLEVKSPDHYGAPRFIKFEADVITCYKLDEEEESNVKKLIKQDYIKRKPLSLDFVTASRIRMTEIGKKFEVLAEGHITKDITVTNDYEKLLPTITNLTDEEIENLRYTIKWNDYKIDVKFNTIYKEKPYIQEINNRLGHKGREIKLFRLNETLLLCFFNNDYLDNIFPIVEIDEEAISICGFPAEPFSVSGTVI